MYITITMYKFFFGGKIVRWRVIALHLSPHKFQIKFLFGNYPGLFNHFFHCSYKLISLIIEKIYSFLDSTDEVMLAAINRKHT